MVLIIFSTFIFILTIGLWLNRKPKRYKDRRYSVVIACRNEENNLSDLLKSIENIEYDKREYEVIFVDDNSSDRSFEILQEFCLKNAQYHLLRTDFPKTGKKQALSKGISFAQYEYVLLTDADCQLPKNYFSEINTWIDKDISKEADMLIGYSPEMKNNLFRRFTYLITASMYACTTGLRMPFSCTGRNLVIKKRAFTELGGYKGIEHLKSGDDKLLLNKFYNAGKRISYIYSPQIETKTVDKKTRKQQDLRRYGKFGMSRLFFQVLSLLVAVFYLYLPYDIIINHNYLNGLLYFICALMYVFSSVFLHREEFRVTYILFILYYPYFLIYKSVKGFAGKWTWK